MKLYFAFTKLCFNFLKQSSTKLFLCFRKLKQRDRKLLSKEVKTEANLVKNSYKVSFHQICFDIRCMFIVIDYT